MKWKCPDCGKMIMDYSEGRFEYNKKQHVEKHQRMIEEGEREAR